MGTDKWRRFSTSSERVARPQENRDEMEKGRQRTRKETEKDG